MLYEKEIAQILETKLAEIDLKQVEEGGKFKVIATNETKDRDGDIITLDGWDIENYRKNPVILANHDYRIENIIGKMTDIYAEDGNIIVEGVFSKSNPLGVLAERLYNEGMLKTVSVGFIGRQRDGEKITSKELLELSFVAVPSNPSAVSLDGKIYAEAVKKGLIKEVKEEVQDEIKGIKRIDAETIDLCQFYDAMWELNKNLFSEIETLSSELKEIRDVVKGLAEDKAENIKSEETRKQAQNLAKALSGYLAEAKKSV